MVKQKKKKLRKFGDFTYHLTLRYFKSKLFRIEKYILQSYKKHNGK